MNGTGEDDRNGTGEDDRLAQMLGSHPLPTWRIVAWPVIVLLIGFFVWAALTDLDEVSVAMGEVVPKGQVKVIQHLEGGIIEEIHVQDGDSVKLDTPLIQLNLASGGVNRPELLVRLDAQILIKARLEAQADGRGVLTFPEEVASRRPSQVISQQQTFDVRQKELDSALRILANQVRQKELEVQELESRKRTLEKRRREVDSPTGAFRQQITQRQQEVKELQARKGAITRNLELGRERLKLSETLLADGLVPKIEHLQLEAEVRSLEGEFDGLDPGIARAQAAVGEIRAQLRQEIEAIDGEIEGLAPAIPRSREAVDEIKERIEEDKLRFAREAQDELSNTEQAIVRITELLVEATEQRGRALIKSPIEGVVKNLAFNTIGGVVRPGDPIMEIVPTGGNLVIEAKLNPTDRGYVEDGQTAVVKISTYDFIRYGSLDGEVIMVAPDSSTAEDGSPYFRVVVQTEKSYLGSEDGKYPISPGMQATVDIRTGKKSVIDYLVKPVLKLRHEAFRER